MKRGSEEINHDTLPCLTQRLCCREISTAEDTNNIPLDLMVEILKKLPTKSLVRFQCVSKQWSSIIGSRRDFIDSIVTRSSTKPPRDTHFIFIHISPYKYPKSDFFIFSSSYYPRNTGEESVFILCRLCQYVRGLIFLRSLVDEASIYNPTTRQSLSLQKMEYAPVYLQAYTSFLGYDPFENQYKVVYIHDNTSESCQVFTLGDPTRKWRKIQCNVRLHHPLQPPVCINGTIYYQAIVTNQYGTTFVLMSFDVKSEKFDQVKAPVTLMNHCITLINYQGKLGFMCCKKEVEIWVMEDAKKKQEWSKIIFYEMGGFERCMVQCGCHSWW